MSKKKREKPFVDGIPIWFVDELAWMLEYFLEQAGVCMKGCIRVDVLFGYPNKESRRVEWSFRNLSGQKHIRYRTLKPCQLLGLLDPTSAIVQKVAKSFIRELRS